MKIIKNFALAMFLLWILQLGFNSCANLVKDFVFKNITISYEDKSENILRKHRAIYGAIGVLAAKRHDKDIEQGWKNGVLAGEIAYLGKKIARKRGLGFFGKMIHSLGASMFENQILNKPLFSRYKIFLPPTSLEFDIQEGFCCHFLTGSLSGILANLAGIDNVIDFDSFGIEVIKPRYLQFLIKTVLKNPIYRLKEFFHEAKELFYDKRDCFQPIDSFLAGTPIFVFRIIPIDINGVNTGGIITVMEDFDALPHEMIHGCQYRELGIANLLIERNAFKEFPLLFSQDLGCILFWRWREKEPKEYGKIYKKKEN